MKYITKIIGIVTLIIFSLNSLYALEINGSVRDENNQPLPGANIFIEGTSLGAQSNFDGNFTIESDNIPISGVVVFSYLGFNTVERNYNGSSTFNITMIEDTESLDDVTVIGCNPGKVRIYNPDVDEYDCVEKILCPVPQTRKAIRENGELTAQECVTRNPSDGSAGLADCTEPDLLKGDCGFDREFSLGLPDTTPDEFVQDVVLTATTFIGTILTVALIVSGLMLVFGGANENTASKGRSGIKYALIGYVVVLVSYAIVRLVQFMVSG